MRCAFASPFHSFIEPEVDDVVQIDVREYGRNRAALRCPFASSHNDSVDKSARSQPFPYQAKDYWVSHLEPYHLHKPLVAQMIEEASDISLEDPIDLAAHQMVAQLPQCEMWAFVRPKSIGTGQKLGLINGLENSCHRPLDQPIFHRGYSERPGLASPFGDLDPPDRRCLVLPSPKAGDNVLAPFHQVPLEVLSGLSINTARPLPVHLLPGFHEEIHG